MTDRERSDSGPLKWAILNPDGGGAIKVRGDNDGSLRVTLEVDPAYGGDMAIIYLTLEEARALAVQISRVADYVVIR